MIITLTGADFSGNNINNAMGTRYTITFTCKDESGGALSPYSGNTSKLKEGNSITFSASNTPLVSGYEFVSASPASITNISKNASVTVTYKVKENSGGSDSSTNYTFTINPNPTSATVTLSATGYSTVAGTGSKSITVANGTIDNWRVSADGYTGQSGTWTANGANETKSVTLSTSSTPDGTPTLVQGYISGDIVNDELKTRVRIDGLVSGAFSIECNDGYVIRAIQECTSTTPSASDANIVTSDQLRTSYSGGSTGKYYAITFCKTNATASISPSESIVKSFSGTIVAITSGDSTTDDTIAGTDVNYTLVQGAHVQNDSSLYQGTNRVTTPKAIKGKFTVTVNSGYAIRAVYEYTKESGDTKGIMVAETSDTRTSFTSSNDSKYYGVTFTLAGPNSANNIAPTEDIVASWKYV